MPAGGSLEDILARRRGMCDLGLSCAAKNEELAAQINKISSAAPVTPSKADANNKAPQDECASPNPTPPWGNPLSAAKGKENRRVTPQKPPQPEQAVKQTPTRHRILAGMCVEGEAAAKMLERRKAVDSSCLDYEEIAEVGPSGNRRRKPRDEEALARVLQARREHITSFEDRAKQGETFGNADVDDALASAARTLRNVEMKAHKEKYDEVLNNMDAVIAAGREAKTPKKPAPCDGGGGGGIKDRIARLTLQQ